MTESDLVKLALSGDESAKERLFKRFEAMAKRLGGRYRPAFGEDAISIGYLGLWEGVMTFDPEKGRLAPHVYLKIANRLKESLRMSLPINRYGNVRYIVPLSLDAFEDVDSVAPGTTEAEEDVYFRSMLDQVKKKLNDRELSILPLLLEGEPIAQWNRNQGLSLARGGQVVKRIREKAQPLIAA